MMAKRDAELTSPDKNEVIPSRTFIFTQGGGGGGWEGEDTLGISDGVVPPVTLKVDPVPELCDH